MSRIDPVTGHIWHDNIHIEIRRKYVSEDAAQIIRDILKGVPVTDTRLVLDSETVLDITNGDYEGTDIELVDTEYAGEWRWGVTYQLVLRDRHGKLWGTYYNVQTGDNYYNSLEDGGKVYFDPFEAVQSVEYRRIKNV